MQSNAAYTLTVNGVMDLAGNAMTTPVVSTFTTGSAPDFNTPSVMAVVPVNGATGVLTTAPIQVQFNKFIDVLYLNSQNVKLSTNGTNFIGAVLTFNPNGMVMTITPNSPLSPSTTYMLQLTTGIVDLEGVQLTSLQTSFTTGTN